jgi:virginiamycin B lyase
MTTGRRKAIGIAAIGFVAIIGLAGAMIHPRASHAAPGGVLLTGTVISDSGEKMRGVVVSAQAAGKLIITSVYTDEEGRYFFPAMYEGAYQVWAQAVGYETGKGQINVSGAVRNQNFTLKATDDFFKQLSQDRIAAALPEDTPQHRKMKDVFENNCTSCHPMNFLLQNRFDKDGWSSIIYLMSRLTLPDMNFGGVDYPPIPAFQFYGDELSTYLAEMRGPGPSPMRISPRPRPAGEAAMAVVTEYDIPSPDRPDLPASRGQDWSLGTPSSMNGARGIHDVILDNFDSAWFTQSEPSAIRSYGKIDLKTGEVTNYTVPGPDGMAVHGHAMTRDQDGILWFNLQPGAPGGPGRLARVDPATAKLDIYTPPAGMAGVGGDVSVDGKGAVWAATETGGIRFDPKNQKFQDFKSLTLHVPTGAQGSYGIAGDHDGNGWWTQISLDIIGKGDSNTGEVSEVKLPKRASRDDDAFTTEERKMYELAATNAPRFTVPGTEAPRRPAADGDILWAPDYFGDNVAKIDIHTLKFTLIPVPVKDGGPYKLSVDKNHNVWITLVDADAVMKYDPKSQKWTTFTLPSIGGGLRHLSTFDHHGTVQVAICETRTGKIAILQERSKQELQALQAQVQQLSAQK